MSPQIQADILDVWIAERRAMIVRDGAVVRGGPGCTIEVQLMHRPCHVFQPINSPAGVPHFGTEAERDEIVRRLNGETPAQS